jgi:peptidoglycan/LPS O-acetylase OafA/YrhL
MGLLRILFALSVVTYHMENTFILFDAALAIRAFYIISGFYMALILNEKYHSYTNFLTNRMLRLFPIYWFVLLLTFIFVLQNHRFVYFPAYFWEFFNLPSFILVVLTNIVILGQDVVMFVSHHPDTGTVFFDPNLKDGFSDHLYYYLLLPQAWTLSLELMFYLIAPFLVKKSSVWIVLVILTGIGLRLGAMHAGLNHEPWLQRFFIFELPFFCLGILSYKIYKKIDTIPYKQWITWILYSVVLLSTIFYLALPLSFLKNFYWAYLAILTVAIPFIFSYFKSIKWDQKIGDLSYPIYITHFLVIRVFYSFARPHLTGFWKTHLWVIISLVTILFSWILVKLISDPVDRLRRLRIK